MTRIWRTGDKLEVTIPMSLRTEPMPDNPNRVAIFYGPTLLAGQLGPENDPAYPFATPKSYLAADGRGPEKDPYLPDFGYVPALRTDAASLLKQIKPVKGQTNVFRTEDIGKPHDVTLQPFFRTHHTRYAVYWDLVTPQQLTALENRIADSQKQWQKLRAQTVDAVTAGETNSETAHAMKGDKLEVDDFNGRPYRLSRGGWFSYQLKVPSGQPTALVCTYWGGERPDTRVFDLLVDGEVIGSQTLATNQPGQYFRVTYPIPAKLTTGKSTVEVTLKAQGDKYAGAVFDLRTVRQ